MKKLTLFFTGCLMICYTSILLSQTTHPTELGINFGTSWLQSDVKMRKIGSGGGFTLGKMYLENETNPIDIGWRFRWLHAVAYGQDLDKSTGLNYNTTLNGTMNPTLNYRDSVGFVYQNHKTDIYETSLEFVIGANSLREQTRFYPYLFGGVGLVKTITYTNQLNQLGVRYDYKTIDSISNGNKSVLQTQLNSMYDGSYETTAQGSEHPEWKLMPSLGIGIGFQVSKLFSIGLEHKITWTLNDIVDGQQWTNANALTGNNDIYHYTSAYMKFSFGRTAPRPHPPVANNQEQANTSINAEPKPTVVITTPNSNPYTSPQKNTTVVAKISHIYSRNDINFTVNGITVTNFTYDNSSEIFTYPATLSNGNNSFVITAGTDVGYDSKSVTILYKDPSSPVAPLPIVMINKPSANPFTTTQATQTVEATVKNVTSKNEIQVTFNGNHNTPFTFSESNKTVSFSCNLTQGSNSFSITATNTAGVDSKSQTIIYQKPVVVQKPVVTITSPASNPFNTSLQKATVDATVLNVASSSEISVKLNGATQNSFTYNPSTKLLVFNADLVVGNNTVVITASNQGGSDSKTTTIIYKLAAISEVHQVDNKTAAGSGRDGGSGRTNTAGQGGTSTSAALKPPVVTFVNPAGNAANCSSKTYAVTATVSNVTGASNITVKLNGTAITNFSFDSASQKVTFTATLIRGANTVIITGTNTVGNDSKTATINFIGS